MEDIEKQLASFGLNQKEIKVYLACLQLGTDAVFNIAARAEVKRATTYLVLKSLEKKGLVTTRATSKSVVFSATSPQNLVLQLEYRKRELEDAIPSLMALYNTQPAKPSIQVFEGLEGMKQIYQEVIESLRDGDEVVFFGRVDHLKDSSSLIKSWLIQAKLAKGNIRELINDDEFHAGYKSLVEENGNPRHVIKVLPKTAKVFLNDNAVFKDKLVIFSTQKTFYVTVIENADIASTYKTMFEFAWGAV